MMEQREGSIRKVLAGVEGRANRAARSRDARKQWLL